MSNRFKSEDARAMGGITLLLNTLDEVSEERKKTTEVADQLRSMNVQEKIKIASIIFTSGDKKANKRLINALKELDLEQNDEFPHHDTIQFLQHQVVACFFDAVGAHNRKIEQMRQNTINRALGSHTVLDDTTLFSKLLYKIRDKTNKPKKRLAFKEDEVYDDFDDLEDFEEEFDDEDDN